MKISFIPLVLFNLIQSTSAFSSGAGRCFVGSASPEGFHPAPPEGEGGELEAGGYLIAVDGEAASSSGTATVTAGVPFEITLSGPTFRGFLIMLAGQPEDALEGDASVSKQAAGTDCAGVAAQTHTFAADLTDVVVTGTIDEPTSTTVEVNIVVRNNQVDGSLYYYTQIPVEVVAGDEPVDPVEPTDEATEPPVDATEPPTAGTGAPGELQEICAEGLIMDNFCIDNVVMLDPAGVTTLLEPEKHTFHCLLDVPQCVDSLYSILDEPPEGQTMYTVPYTFDAESSAMLRELGQSVGKQGRCTTCTATDGPEVGFRAAVLGVVVDPNVNPPVVQITSMKDTTTEGSWEGCSSWDGSMPDTTDAPADTTDAPEGDSGSSFSGSSFVAMCFSVVAAILSL